jgi:hypothetical protein
MESPSPKSPEISFPTTGWLPREVLTYLQENDPAAYENCTPRDKSGEPLPLDQIQRLSKPSHEKTSEGAEPGDKIIGWQSSSQKKIVAIIDQMLKEGGRTYELVPVENEAKTPNGNVIISGTSKSDDGSANERKITHKRLYRIKKNLTPELSAKFKERTPEKDTNHAYKLAELVEILKAMERGGAL